MYSPIRVPNYLAVILLFISCSTPAQKQNKLVPVAEGWSQNSVNTVIFRKNSLVSHDSIQFVAFYDSLGHMVLGKRNLNSAQWELKKTSYKGNVKDAHNSISIMVDGDGYLHVSWDHHNNPLNYARGKAPFFLDLTDKMPMIGENESSVSYPEFYRMPDGNLLFFYRDGESGRGNLIINRYDVVTRKWSRLHSNLISGEGQRNAYWQAFVDENGSIHISWVWRETWDVATNHDLCYAVSHDGGKTWVNSKKEKYELPITQGTAEVAWYIPQKSELINQTSMYADASGKPYIVSYWTESSTGSPQYQLVFNKDGKWQKQVVSSREGSFSLSGGGTKAIPISRPQVVVEGNSCSIIFRDEERGSKASVFYATDLDSGAWQTLDLTDFSVGSWEPSYDTELWKTKHQLHIFLQKTSQGDGETLVSMPPQMIYILEVK